MRTSKERSTVKHDRSKAGLASLRVRDRKTCGLHHSTKPGTRAEGLDDARAEGISKDHGAALSIRDRQIHGNASQSRVCTTQGLREVGQDRSNPTAKTHAPHAFLAGPCLFRPGTGGASTSGSQPGEVEENGRHVDRIARGVKAGRGRSVLGPGIATR